MVVLVVTEKGDGPEGKAKRPTAAGGTLQFLSVTFGALL